MKLLATCSVGFCPAIYEDGDDLLIIGKRRSSSHPDKVAFDEEAVAISEDLLNAAGFYRKESD